MTGTSGGGPPPTLSSAHSLWCHPRVYSAENVQNLLGARLGLVVREEQEVPLFLPPWGVVGSLVLHMLEDVGHLTL